MKLPNSAQTSRPWRIHEIVPDFPLEDVWAMPTPGGPDDFPRLVRLVTSLDPGKGSSRAVRALFAIRWKLGDVFGWEDPGGYRGQMSVYVKPNGRFGNAYMAAIAPFRNLLVYPVMLREIGRAWRTDAGEPTPART